MLIDNKANGKVGDTLKEAIVDDTRLSLLTGLFSIYAFDALRHELHKAESVRVLLSLTGIALSENDDLPIHLAGDTFETRLKNQLNQAHIAQECVRWLEKKTVIVQKSKQAGLLGQTLFHLESDNAFAIQGGSHFTTSGLGYSESPSFEMNMGISDTENTKALLSWFDGIWHSNAVEDAKQILIKRLHTLFDDRSPQFIYFLTLYHLFKEFLEDIDEDNIIRSKTGVNDSKIWNMLYRFQRDGALGAIDKLERYNGCIIADSVGLGKTFEALAIIKYYELRNDRVLVLCPKKLRDNWTVYTVNDKRNILASDRFNYDVLNHTDLTRETGMSGEINLESINWGNYDLIVIDESHNFRNNNRRKDGKTRYSHLMQEVIRSGVKTKVLMLSATPVNNRMNDLKNQVAFITEGKDDALETSNIPSIEHTLKKAQSHFNAWVKQDIEQRTAERLLNSMNFDYFKLLDLLTIARSRKHIEKYYSTEEMGEFPERLKPENIKSDIDTKDQFPTLHRINRTIRRLNLSAYSMLKYVRIDKLDAYSRKYDIQITGGRGVFKQADREESLIHLMRVNLLKRMESSIHSFHLTVGNLLTKVDDLLDKIDEHEASNEIIALNIEDIALDSSEFEPYLLGNKVKVLIQDMDHIRWRQDLLEDRYQLQKLLEASEAIDTERDAKLHDLQCIIRQKVEKPLNKGNQKLIIFTAFADTAIYLYKFLSPWIQQSLGLHSALVTGTGRNKSTLKGVSSDLSALLMHFSPHSKERHKVMPEATDEIDILIATDCISEGQNLQDCDTLINYDIHWNPVRIIQRFGRIDRLGSRNSCIKLINFWPNMALDEYINLEARVSGRMVLLDISATGEENVIEQERKDQMNDLEYRRKQLEQLQEAIPDLEDLAGGVSITDLTLNAFRMDLSAYMKAYENVLEESPIGLYAATMLDDNLKDEGIQAGTIFCLKNIKNPIYVDAGYALAPYFLVYVTENNTIQYTFSQSRQIMDVLKKQAVIQTQTNSQAITCFNQKTHHGKDMQCYRKQLAIAIDSIVGKSQEQGIQSLFNRGGTVLKPDESQHIDDFEVVSYVVLF